jgi:hypothetical protein
VAATYRAEDDAYYILDQRPGGVRLMRLARGLELEEVGKWAQGTIYTEGYGLTRGVDGSLVITTSGTDARHCISAIAMGSTNVPGEVLQYTGTGYAQVEASLGAGGNLALVTRDAAGGKVYVTRRKSEGVRTDLAGVGTCF